MALRVIDGFDTGVPFTTNVTALTVGSPIAGTPYTLLGGATGNYSDSNVSFGDGWMRLYTRTLAGNAGGSSKQVAARRPLSTLTSSLASAVLYGGVRLMLPDNLNMTYLVTMVDNAKGTTGQTPLLLSDIPNPVVGKEYYFEWCLDVPNAKIQRWLDGVPLADQTLNANMNTNIKNNDLAISFGVPFYISVPLNVSPTLKVRDVYILEKTADGVMSNRLGPQRVQSIDVGAVDTPIWVPTTGTVASALNTAFTDTASLTAPLVNTDDLASVQTLKLTAPQFSGPVTAMQIKASAAKSANSRLGAASLGAVLSSGGVDSSAGALLLTTAYQYDAAVLNLGPLSPDGKPWTNALLEAATLKLII